MSYSIVVSELYTKYTNIPMNNEYTKPDAGWENKLPQIEFLVLSPTNGWQLYKIKGIVNSTAHRHAEAIMEETVLKNLHV